MSKAKRRELLDSLEVAQCFWQDVACLNADVTRRAQKPPVLLEVFAGSMHLTLWKCVEPIDVDMGHNGLDLTTKVGQDEVTEVITEQSPDLISWAPPCEPYSSLQNIRVMPQNPKKRQLKWFRLLKKRRYASLLVGCGSFANSISKRG